MKYRIAILLASVAVVGCENSPRVPKAKAEPPLLKLEPAPVVQAEVPAQPTIERVEAKVGVGLKGRGLDPYEGAVVTPAKSYFAAKEMVAFDIQVPQALALYEATEGHAPASHEEFWEKVVKPNQLDQILPMLPPGHKYVYDPQQKQLLVERPAAQNTGK